MSMNPKHGQTVSSLVVPYPHDTVVTSLCWGQHGCVAIKSQCRYLQRNHKGRYSVCCYMSLGITNKIWKLTRKVERPHLWNVCGLCNTDHFKRLKEKREDHRKARNYMNHQSALFRIRTILHARRDSAAAKVTHHITAHSPYQCGRWRISAG